MVVSCLKKEKNNYLYKTILKINSLKTYYLFYINDKFLGYYYSIILSISKLFIGSVLISKSIIYSPSLFIWLVIYGLKAFISALLTLQRLKHVGFLHTFTSKYTRKHTRLMNFYRTFTTNHSFE